MKKFILLLTVLFAQHGVAQAQALQYRPLNPAFGGNTFNYQWLQGSALAQDTNKDPNAKSTASTRPDPNSATEFSANLQRQLLSRLSRQLLDRQFGEEGLQEGTFQFGDLQVEVTEGSDGVIIRISDGKGGESTITVPYF
ncbi:MAG: curli assembly protein CsgF [Cytophagaceae bacterium]|nr:curli assembly protein CsgF [Cytophagaceae bacterium]